MRYATLVLVLAVGACGAEGAPSSFQERDSAGIRVAESTAPRWADSTPWVVAPVPTLDLSTSGSGPSHEFFRIRDATRLTDGRIVVANGGTFEVRLYSADGSAQGTVGREGEGPGEFARIESVARYRGDSLVVFDDELRRITVLTSDGTLGRTSQLSGFDGTLEELYPTSGGRFLLRTYAVQMEAIGRIRDPAPILLVSPDGAASTEVARAAGFEHHSFDGSDGTPAYPHDSHVTATDELLFVGDATQLDFQVYALDGRLVRIVRVPGFDLNIPQSERDSVRASMLARELPASLRAIQEEMANNIPAIRPAYSDLLVDAEGFTWVAGYRTSTALSPKPREWIVFGVDGEWLGTVALPPNFDLYEAGTDYLLGRSRNDLGVETVQLLTLTRR